MTMDSPSVYQKTFQGNTCFFVTFGFSHHDFSDNAVQAAASGSAIPRAARIETFFYG
jgi:hypothetical protein